MKNLVFISLLLVLIFAHTGCHHQSDDYPVKGIDVSHYQKEIDWQKVKKENISFAFIKASEGPMMRDSFFEQNWNALDTIHVRRGAYHFFHAAQSVEQQVRNFTDVVKLKKGDLPPVLDVEDLENMSPEDLVSKVKIWLNFVELYYGLKPIVYTNINFYLAVLSGRLEDYPLWIARYNRYQPDAKWQFWQFSDHANLNGITNKVDINVFRGNLTELDSLCLR